MAYVLMRRIRTDSKYYLNTEESINGVSAGKIVESMLFGYNTSFSLPQAFFISNKKTIIVQRNFFNKISSISFTFTQTVILTN